jgi:hypothetical protein
LFEPERRLVSIPLDPGAFANYDDEKRSGVEESDSFAILIGNSSRDIRLRSQFRLAAQK